MAAQSNSTFTSPASCLLTSGVRGGAVLGRAPFLHHRPKFGRSKGEMGGGGRRLKCVCRLTRLFLNRRTFTRTRENSSFVLREWAASYLLMAALPGEAEEAGGEQLFLAPRPWRVRTHDSARVRLLLLLRASVCPAPW